MTAKGAHVIEKLRDETECCICTGTFVDPRLLPCLHTFCLKCLETHVATLRRGPRKMMACPVCRKEFSIPDSGLVGLQKNFLVERLIDIVKEPTSKESTSTDIPCEACLEDVDPHLPTAVAPAEMYCADCQQKLCNECSAHHRKNKMTKLHTISQLVDKSKAKHYLLKNCVKKCCAVHKSVNFVYCMDCMDDFCQHCSARVHKGHRSSSRVKIIDDYGELFDAKLSEFADAEHRAQKLKEDVEKKKDAFIQEMDLLDKVITERSEKIKMLVDSHTKLLQDEIESKKQKVLEEIKVEKGQIENLQSVVIRYRHVCFEREEFPTIEALIVAMDSLKAKAQELSKLCEASLNCLESGLVKITFKESDIDDFLGKSNVVGKVEVVEAKPRIALPPSHIQHANINEDTEESWLFASSEKDYLQDYSKNPARLKVIKTSASRDDNKAVSGITVFGEELYIVHEESTDVYVYDADSFEDLRVLEVDELDDPIDITSCESNDCLYVFDWNDVDLYKIFCLNDEGDVLRQWKTGKSSGSLSITHDSNVVVAFRDRNILKEYSGHGRLLRELVIRTEDGVNGLLHARKLHSGLFLISYSGGESKRHGLILVDGNGDVLKSVSETEGAGIRFDVPCFFTTDDADSILLVDKNLRKVIVLSADLDRSVELLTNYKGGLFYPLRVFLDELNGRLFVADNWYDRNNEEFRNGRVLVFQVRNAR